MKLSIFSKAILAARREIRRMETDGFRLISESQRLDIPYGQKIIDARVASHCRGIFYKLVKA